MSRAKQAKGRMWKYVNKEREKKKRTPKKDDNKKIKEEEHKKRIEALKKAGLLKD